MNNLLKKIWYILGILKPNSFQVNTYVNQDDFEAYHTQDISVF